MKSLKRIFRDRIFRALIGCCIVLMFLFVLSGCQNVFKDVHGNQPEGTSVSPTKEVISETEAPKTDTSAEAEASSEAISSMEEVERTVPYSVNEGSILEQLPVYTYDEFSKHKDMGDDAEMLIFEHAATDEGFVHYQDKLEKLGYQLYTEHQIEKNQFATWVNEEITVTMVYMPSKERVHVIAEPTGKLPGLEADNVYDDLGVENLAAQVGGDFNGSKKNGMCYVYRLCDGSFIIVDAPHQPQVCADALYNTLRKLAPDPENIVIAAWFITHAHNDHVGGVITFANSYADQVTLEQLVYNFPSEKDFRRGGANYDYAEQTKALESCYEAVEVIEAHPGQVFYLRDARIEMLYTWELMEERVEYFNNTSLVFTVELGDERIMQLGDCGPIASELNISMYGDYLKSDIMQVAHHGSSGALAQHNEIIDADVVLWPSNKDGFLAYQDQVYNQPLYEAEIIYLAEGNVTVLPLPYDPNSVKIWAAYEN